VAISEGMTQASFGRCTAVDQRSGIPQSVRREADRRISEDVVEDRQAGCSASRYHAPCAAPELASLAADLGYNEPTVPILLGHKTHSITSRYVHSADAVLLAAADVVANATMNLMCDKDSDPASDQAQPQLRDQRGDGSVVWDEVTVL
jgi:hypothetical protein